MTIVEFPLRMENLIALRTVHTVVFLLMFTGYTVISTYILFNLFRMWCAHTVNFLNPHLSCMECSENGNDMTKKWWEMLSQIIEQWNRMPS